MCSDAEFGVSVHAPGTNLDLQRLAARTYDRGMQRLVIVVLGIGDVVVELPGQVRPEVMNDAQRGIALSHVVHENPDGPDVENMLETALLSLHFAPDTVDVLRAPRHLGLDAGCGQLAFELVADIVDELFALCPFFLQQACNAFVGSGFQKAESEVLEFPFQLPDAQATR